MDIGRAVRFYRESREITLTELAKLTGITKGGISKIENGKTIPNVITMKEIANALDVPVSYFFIDEEEELIHFIKKGEKERFIRNTSEKGDVYEEMIVNGKDLHMQPCIITFTNGSDSGKMIKHKGEEFIYNVQGKIRCTLDGIGEYILEEGDSMYYPSYIPHRWENLDAENEARLMVIASPALF